MSRDARHDAPRFGLRAAFLAGAVLGVYVLQLGATIFHVTDEHRTLAPVHHHDPESPDHDHDGPSNDEHSAADHLDGSVYRRPQIDSALVVTCEPAFEVDLTPLLSTAVELDFATPAGIHPSPGPPSRAPPAAWPPPSDAERG